MRTSPNSKFIGITAIKRAQIEAGDREIDEEGSDITDKLSSILSHITID